MAEPPFANATESSHRRKSDIVFASSVAFRNRKPGRIFQRVHVCRIRNGNGDCVYYGSERLAATPTERLRSCGRPS